MAITPLSLFLPLPPRSAGLAAVRAAESTLAANPAALVDSVLNDSALADGRPPAAGSATAAVTLPATDRSSPAAVTAALTAEPAGPAIAAPASASDPDTTAAPQLSAAALDNSGTAALQNEIRRQQNQLLQLAVTPETAADAATSVTDENLLTQRLLLLRQNDSASLTEAVRQAAAELARQQQDLLQNSTNGITDLTSPDQQPLSTGNINAQPSPVAATIAADGDAAGDPVPATEILGRPTDSTPDVASPTAAAPIATPPAVASPTAAAPVATSPAVASPTAAAPVATPPAAASPTAAAPIATPPAAALPTAAASVATPTAVASPTAVSPEVSSPVASPPPAVAPPAGLPVNTLRAAAAASINRPRLGALEPFMLYNAPLVPAAAVADLQIVIPPLEDRIVTATSAAADSLQNHLPRQAPYAAERAYTARGTVVMAADTPVATSGGQIDERV